MGVALLVYQYPLPIFLAAGTHIIPFPPFLYLVADLFSFLAIAVRVSGFSLFYLLAYLLNFFFYPHDLLTLQSTLKHSSKFICLFSIFLLPLPSLLSLRISFAFRSLPFLSTEITYYSSFSHCCRTDHSGCHCPRPRHLPH